jgi:ankyrin repeat protein
LIATSGAGTSWGRRREGHEGAALGAALLSCTGEILDRTATQRRIARAAAAVLRPWTLLLSLAIAAVPAAAALAQTGKDAALILAAKHGELNVVRQLLADGARVNARDKNGRTALMVATRRNYVEVARLLIREGADVNAKDLMQDTPFLYAGAEGLIEILKMTLATGADLSSTNRFGGTALIPACHHGHVEAVKLLLATTIDVDHVNNLGWTALLEAVILGDGGPTYVEIVRLLIAGRVNVNIADRDGVTPLTHAQQRGFAAIAQSLMAAGAK